ncbi:hypothetical protein CDL12_10591 [Handroanthus impetiginosus]|uniref:Uncharacterized protein n=1 Tax=Handroanthus impetiginosus TaxID=429701 RepID=A0A2G9HGX2_9LAMI|nr:hypothetical protein CDL12_10591 [Handroanthus impetiginosus]
MEDEGSSGKHLKENTCASNNKHVVFKPVISTVILDHGSGSRSDPETNLEGIGHGSGKDSDSSSSGSSTSSNSASDDFIQLNPQILPKFRVQNNIPKPKGGTKRLYKNEKTNVSSEVSSEVLYRSKESVNEPPKSIPQVSDVAHVSLVPHVSPTQAPTIQVMGRTGGFDPNRIPASIFSKPSTTPMEWSVASNDSLFSIHLGNSSFSRDQVSSMGVDLHKSGELFRSEELCQPREPLNCAEVPQSREVYNSGELYQSIEHVTASDMKRSGDLIGLEQTFPTTEGVGLKESLDMVKTIRDDMSSEETGMTDEPINYLPTSLMNNQVDTNIGESMDYPSANRRNSDKSETTIQPSPFPRKKKSSCLPCHCSNSCWMFSCCKWSYCSCKWIHWPPCSTSCLSWKSCCCNWPSHHCKCPNWSSCCCKCSSWPSCGCLSCSSCTCASWPSCKFQCSNCTWTCCYCWNHGPKRVCCDSSHVCSLTDRRINACKIGCPKHENATLPNTLKATKKQWPCFSCSSTCSCCACCSCSCCC